MQQLNEVYMQRHFIEGFQKVKITRHGKMTPIALWLVVFPGPTPCDLKIENMKAQYSCLTAGLRGVDCESLFGVRAQYCTRVPFDRV